MTLVTFDLDDTLMWCGKDYTTAKQEVGEFISDNADISPEEAIEVVNGIDKENVDKFGLSRERFPNSFVEAYCEVVETPTEAGRETARELGASVFKTEKEYRERGLMEGAEDVLESLTESEFELHLITAGDEQVQQRKIDGLGLGEYFDGTHIVPINSKDERLETLVTTNGFTSEGTFHVGNSLTSDVKAAIEAGVNSVYVPNHNWRQAENAEYYETHERVTIYESLGHLGADIPDVFLSTEPAI